MADFDLVEVLNACEYLVEKSACLTVLQPALFYDVVEQFAPTRVLHDQKQLLGCLDNFIELHDVRVSDDFQNVDLTHDSSDVSLVLDLVFFKHFDCDLLLGQLVDAFPNFAERARAYSLSYQVVADHTVVSRVIFLSTLGRLPVASLQFVLLLFKLGEGLSETRL